MNNYYTLIYLIREWKEKIKSAHFVEAISAKKNILELYFENDSSQRMVFSTYGQHAALFIDKFQNPQRLNSAVFFEHLKGLRLFEIELADRDRYITFQFENDYKLIFLLYSNHANAFLVHENLVIEAYKKDRSLAGQPAPLPAPVSGSASITSDFVSTDMNTLIRLTDPLLPRPVLKSVIPKSVLSNNVDSVTNKINRISEQLNQRAIPHFTEQYGFSIIDPEITGIHPTRRFTSVNEAVAYSFYQWVRYEDFETRKKELMLRLDRSLIRVRSALAELKNATLSEDKAGLYEKFGHLLMSMPNKTTTTDKLVVDDYFNPGQRIKIPVTVNEDLIFNAKKYYDKAKKTRREASSLEGRIKDFEKRELELIQTKESLQAIQYGKELDKWVRQHQAILKRIGHTESGETQTAQHYRSTQIGKYEIRIGKSAVSNDELLRISHKEDIWLHARAVSGSHVVICMNRDLGMPPKDIIDKAASFAAFYSKLRGSSLVPVIFTKKKYVRKSKGLPAGAVMVDKEQVVLVPPESPNILENEEK